ncbi:ABC transporter ATP-binding protein [bacterium]|nr:ABC transporter ATP-binding protein [bacterium]
MIVYHLSTADRVPAFLAKGLTRSQGRFYVLSDWECVQKILSALSLETTSLSDFERHVVLVLRVDPEMLVADPMPDAHLPALLRGDGRALARYSYYLETDLDRLRILGVKDAWGNLITRRFAPEGRRREALWRFLSYVKPYRHFVALATLAGLGKFLLPLSFAWMSRVVLDDVLLNQNASAAARAAHLRRVALTVLAAYVLWMLCCYARSLFTALAGHRMIRDLRVALFNHVQRLSHQFFSEHQTGSIVSRVVNDIAQAQNFVGSALTNVWMDGSLLVVLLVILFSKHVTLTLVAVALIPVYLLSIRMVGRRIRLSSREVQARVEILSGGLQEKVAGVGIVKGFTRESDELDAFRTQSNKLYSKVLHTVRLAATNEMVVGAVVLSSPVLVLWYGAHLVMAGQLSPGQLMQFAFLLPFLYSPLQRLSDLSAVLSTSLASIDRIFEYFDTQPQVAEKPDAITLEKVEGRIEFDAVHFAYEPGVEVLSDISLVVEPGETVAFVGPSGSGKSTLSNLIPRFYDPSSGVIRLDGHDLRDLSLSGLRRHIGIVNQETILFSGTVRENLLLAKPNAGPEEIMEALAAANALDFVSELPEGLWTEIGERGVKLSGGQRQRLAIARAFLKNPRILILDEATSALDSKSEHHIQEALARLLVGRTSIVIAHRLSTILGADKIVVLDRGRIVESGGHAQLLGRRGLYAQLYEEQFHRVAHAPATAD